MGWRKWKNEGGSERERERGGGGREEGGGLRGNQSITLNNRTQVNNERVKCAKIKPYKLFRRINVKKWAQRESEL